MCRSRRRLIYDPKIQSLWWLEKQSPWFFPSKNLFSTRFWPKTHRKHARNLIKPNHYLQKPKKTSLKPETKNLPRLRDVFLGIFKIKKKTPNLNHPHYMEPFDTKLYVLVSWIFPNDNFLSLSHNPATTSLSSTRKRTEKGGKWSLVPQYIFF